MTGSELIRKLLYCGYSDVTDYLKNSPLNRFIYKRLLVIRPQFGIKTDIVTIFNEMYFQLVHIQTDRKPGLDLEKRFLNEAVDYLGETNAAMLVFSMVRAFYERKDELTFEEECFWEQFNPLIQDIKFESLSSELYHYLEREGYVVPDVFEIKHVPFKKLAIPLNYENRRSFLGFIKRQVEGFDGTEDRIGGWAEVTENFSPKAIEWLLSLYPNLQDRLGVLSLIEFACPDKLLEKKGFDITKIRLQIQNEIIENEKDEEEAVTPEEAHHYQCPDEEDYDRMFAEGYNRTMAEAEKEEAAEQAEQYKQECDRLRFQIDEQRKEYESKMAQREMVFRTEMESMRQEMVTRFEVMASQQAKQMEQVKELVPKGFAITIADMTEYVKEFFNEEAANQFINMYYHFALPGNNLDDAKLMDEIIPAIHQRLTLHQSYHIDTVKQFNNRPEKVINGDAKEDENKDK